MEKENQISSVFNDFIKTIKEWVEPSNVQQSPITKELLVQLKSELIAFQKLIDSIESNKKFFSEISVLHPEFKNIKLGQMIFFEIAQLYSSAKTHENSLSKFVLAYYYDVLVHSHFGDEQKVEAYNQLIVQIGFDNITEAILLNNKTPDKLSKEGSFSIIGFFRIKDSKTAESFIEKYQLFIKTAFNRSFEKPEEFTKAFAIEPFKNVGKEQIRKDDTLEKVMVELNALIGLKNIKEDINDLINFLSVQKKRTENGLKNAPISLHTVFLGPPGTGKTTVARLLGRIFKHLGYLTNGHTTETDREGLVAGFVGQTASKVDTIVTKSIGGVLFIDEAYAISANSFGNDFGSEAISSLLKRMEDNRTDLSVVVAGYNEPMREFIASNPGLRSRFNRYFTFEHFTSSELLEIFVSFAKSSDFIPSKSALEKLSDTFELFLHQKSDTFGNARDVRNIFEKCVHNQANRIMKLKSVTPRILKTITESDVPEPKESLDHITYFNSKNVVE